MTISIGENRWSLTVTHSILNDSRRSYNSVETLTLFIPTISLCRFLCFFFTVYATIPSRRNVDDAIVGCVLLKMSASQTSCGLYFWVFAPGRFRIPILCLSNNDDILWDWYHTMRYVSNITKEFYWFSQWERGIFVLQLKQRARNMVEQFSMILNTRGTKALHNEGRQKVTWDIGKKRKRRKRLFCSRPRYSEILPWHAFVTADKKINSREVDRAADPPRRSSTRQSSWYLRPASSTSSYTQYSLAAVVEPI